MKTIEQAADFYSATETDSTVLTTEKERHALTFHTTKAFIAGAKFAQQWIDVNDRLPTKPDTVIAVTKDGNYHIGFCCFGRAFVNYTESKVIDNVTHYRYIELK